jgi:hypothetical protein
MRHCRICYRTGHNKRTCPSYTQRLKEGALGEIDQEATSGESASTYYRDLYMKRTGLNPATGAKVAGVKRKQKRQCTWCKNRHGQWQENFGWDHNRRTCQDRKDWHSELVGDVANWRSEFLERMKSHGFGVGTLIKKQSYGYWPDPDTGEQRYGSAERVMIVTKINWDRVHQHNRSETVVVVQDVGKPTETEGVRIPKEVEYTGEEDNYDRLWDTGYEVLNGSGSQATIPAGWIDGQHATVDEPY